jgi:hypothetical protein
MYKPLCVLPLPCPTSRKTTTQTTIPDVLGRASTVTRLLLSAVKAASTTDGTKAWRTSSPAAAAADREARLGAVTTGLRGDTCGDGISRRHARVQNKDKGLVRSLHPQVVQGTLRVSAASANMDESSTPVDSLVT